MGRGRRVILRLGPGLIRVGFCRGIRGRLHLGSRAGPTVVEARFCLGLGPGFSKVRAKSYWG